MQDGVFLVEGARAVAPTLRWKQARSRLAGGAGGEGRSTESLLSLPSPRVSSAERGLKMRSHKDTLVGGALKEGRINKETGVTKIEWSDSEKTTKRVGQIKQRG